jgi:hypothetical protein
LRRSFGIFAAVLALAHPAAADELDPARLSEARSLTAEALALDRAQLAGRVSEVYAEALREDLRAGLLKLKKETGFSAIANTALSAMARRDDAALGGLRDRLVALERSHGRAD